MDPSEVAAYAAQFHPQQPPFSAVTPTFPHPSPSLPLPSHPSYTEMITAAIAWENSQGKVGGSSKRAIAKYIDRVYSNLPPTHSALLTHHLKRLKNAGQLLMIKNSYQLPSFAPAATNGSAAAAAAAAAVPIRSEPEQPAYAALSVVNQSPQSVKRRPGRPAKPKQPEEPAQAQAQQVQEQQGVGGSEKRGRGRPAKRQREQEEVAVPFVQPLVVVAGEVSNGLVGKRRGRPKKKPKKVVEDEDEDDHEHAEDAMFQVEVEEVVNGGVGAEEEEEVAGLVKRGRGRLPKEGVGRGRGRPKKIEVVVGGVSEGGGGKKRGWPKGRPRGRKVMGMVGKMGKVMAVGYAGKKRGRKPKGSVPAVAAAEVAKRLYKGKPRGRPKKNSVLAKHTSTQAQGPAAEELMKKLEDMQSKIRDAVGVIKPYLADQSAPDVLSALQQLEELSTMDVTISPTSTPPPAPPAPIDVTAPPPSTSIPSLTDSTIMAFTATSGMDMPFMNVPSITVTEPLLAPSNTENHEPISWGAPGEAES
ncbi:hypothetical protein vseg_004496 [Gypsophila vaccaria]